MAEGGHGPKPIELSIDQEALVKLGKALKEAGDGKALRRDLTKRMRAALKPAKTEVRSLLMAMPVQSSTRVSPPLRQAVVRQLGVEVRYSGRDPGVKIRVKKRGMPRGFRNAGKVLAMPRGWRHLTFGHEPWVRQVGQRDYFDRPVQRRRKEYRAAVLSAMAQTIKELKRRAS